VNSLKGNDLRGAIRTPRDTAPEPGLKTTDLENVDIRAIQELQG